MDEVESLRTKLKAKDQELSQYKSKLKLEAAEKSKLIEANRVLSNQVHLRANFMQEKEDAHSKVRTRGTAPSTVCGRRRQL